ncbi:phage tail assembly chaperone [Desulfobaculum xiamenense]|uniref:phage tail assembly chaperone n=1 Tax=Desulfobaculum xiamenense TaxID=995050 RepID=UPI003CC911B2
MEAFKAHLTLNAPRKDGQSLRAHLEQVARDSGEPPEELTELLGSSRPPDAGGYLLEWFWELHAARGQGMGPEAIGFVEIEAWARLTGRAPEPWEVAVLQRLDRTYFEWRDSGVRS